MQTLTEHSPARLTLQDHSFIYNIIRLSDASANLAATTSADSLLFLHATSSALELLETKPSIHKSVTCLSSFSHDFTAITRFLTAGRDGNVHIWNAAKRAVLKTLRTPHETDKISALATTESLIAAGTELEAPGPGDVSVFIWDPETSSMPIRTYSQTHSDTLTSLFFLPPVNGSTPHFVTASTDSLIVLFNPAESDEDDAVLSVVNTGGPINHIAPSQYPNEGSTVDSAIHVWCVSHDEKLSLHSLGAETAAAQVDVREALGVDYTVALVPGDKEHVTVMAGANKADVPFVVVARFSSSLPGELEELLRLEGAHSDEVVRGCWVNGDEVDGAPGAVTVGEDSTVRLWKNGEGKDIAMGERVEHQRDGRRMKKKSRKSESGRFKPY